MSNVEIYIANRQYRVACDAGEEAHLERLGAMIDGRLQSLPGIGGQSEARMLLYAALLLADDLHERAKDDNALPAPEELADPLEKLAEMLEATASRLEQGAAST